MSQLEQAATTSLIIRVTNRLQPYFGRRAAGCFLGAAIGLVGVMVVFDVSGGRTPAGGILVALLAGAALSLGFIEASAGALALRNEAPPAPNTAVELPTMHGPRPVPQDDEEESFPRLFAKQAQMLDTLAGDCNRLLTNDLVVSDVMTTGVTTALPETPVERLAVLMRELDVHHLIVCSADRGILGIVSDRDVISPGGKQAADVMTSDPFTLPPEALMRTAMTHMIERRISSLPIVSEGRLVGILTTTDVIIAFQCMMQVVRAAAANLTPKRGAESSAAGMPLALSP